MQTYVICTIINRVKVSGDKWYDSVRRRGVEIIMRKVEKTNIVIGKEASHHLNTSNSLRPSGFRCPTMMVAENNLRL